MVSAIKVIENLESNRLPINCITLHVRGRVLGVRRRNTRGGDIECTNGVVFLGGGTRGALAEPLTDMRICRSVCRGVEIVLSML